MALDGLYCADVPLIKYSLTHCHFFTLMYNRISLVCISQDTQTALAMLSTNIFSRLHWYCIWRANTATDI